MQSLTCAVCCTLDTALGISIEKFKLRCPVEVIFQCSDSDDNAEYQTLLSRGASCSIDFTYFIFPTMLEGGHHYQPHLTDKEAEV